MKKKIITALFALTVIAGCKKEADKKECSTITGEGLVVLDKPGATQRYFTLSNGKKVKTYINTMDAYHIGSEICYRPDEVFQL